MARKYEIEDNLLKGELRRVNAYRLSLAYFMALFCYLLFPFSSKITIFGLIIIAAIIPCCLIIALFVMNGEHFWIEKHRQKESEARGGNPVLGHPPDRLAFSKAIKKAKESGKKMLDTYLVGFELESGEPIWVDEDAMCEHGAVFAKTGVGKTLWLESIMFQQMARGRASGMTFIDAKRDPGTLADIIIMALLTGRIEDLVVIDPFEPSSSYNFVFTTQRPDVKARKVLRCGLPPLSDDSLAKHYDRLASDAVFRVVRAMESLGLAWSVRDVAVALSAFGHAYPRLRGLLDGEHETDAMIELGHMADTYRNPKGNLDPARLTENLRGIASELHSISNSEAGEMFCVPKADLSLTDAIHRGKIIYYMLPRLEEAESASRMVKVFREDLEVSIGEVTSSRVHHLEDPHIIFVDEGASTFGPTWANLFELARKGRFALLFGAQSVGGLMDETMGLSEQFYERVMANVNLKVIMRLGDNKTAEDMADWIGEVVTTKKSLSSALSSGVNARELTKNIEFNRRSSDSFRDAITVADDENYLVSPEELKHEMSAEKGLAWFDKGDGILRKGRALWFNADLPSTWEGRENLVLYDTVEADEIGLAEWIDGLILSHEQDEQHRMDGRDGQKSSYSQQQASNATKKPKPTNSALNNITILPSKKELEDDSPEPESPKEKSSPFKLNIGRSFKGLARSQTTIVPSSPVEKPAEKRVEEEPKEKPFKFSLDRKSLKSNATVVVSNKVPEEKIEISKQNEEKAPLKSANQRVDQKAEKQAKKPKSKENLNKKTKKSSKFMLHGRSRDVVSSDDPK